MQFFFKKEKKNFDIHKSVLLLENRPNGIESFGLSSFELADDII